MPLTVLEDTSGLTERTLREDREIIVWWETEAECVGALAKKFRTGHFTDAEVNEALELLAILVDNWTEIRPTDQVRIRAERLLFNHDLSTADAMQLASALHWCEDDSRTAQFVCQDLKLRMAARREGFTVLPTLDELGIALGKSF